MQLLVTQMRNQDPLDPVKQQDFVGQLAQFSTLESLEQMNANFGDLLKLQELAQGTNLLGRSVSYLPEDGGSTATTGLVDAVQVDEGKLVLQVDGAAIPIDRVQQIIA